MSKYLKTKFNDFVTKLNENRESLILYHGSKTKFELFDDSKMGSGEGSGLFGDGFYLTDSKEVADFYGRIAAKKDKIVKTTYDGILGSEQHHYSDDADEYARKNSHINIFKVEGRILDASTFTIDDDFKNHLVTLTMKHSGFGDYSMKMVTDAIEYSRKNYHVIRNFRGELIYVIGRIGFGDINFLNDVVSYIKSKGYDGIKYESDSDFEGKGYHNYIIFNKNSVTSLK